MFISYLLPFVDRGAGAPHLWVFLAQMARFDPSEIAFIGDERYFSEAGIPFGKTLSVAGIVFEVPSRERFQAYRKQSLERNACGFESELQLDLFHEVLTKPVDGLIAQIATATESLSRGNPIQAFITWSNCPSLSVVAGRMDVPVIHNEIGPLRSPDYLNTVYFDVRGVNGGSTPSHWTSGEAVAAQMQGAHMLDEEALRSRLRMEDCAGLARRGARVGVALQVEDDSNIIAYSRGWNSLRLIYKAAARDAEAAPVLIRNHPHARFSYKGGLGEVDESSRALDFLGQLSFLYSINSSLLTEAFLWDVPFQALGDCPVVNFSEGGPLSRWQKENRALALNAFFLGYLVPASLLFSPAYYEWRVQSERTLAQCHEYHLRHIETVRSERHLAEQRHTVEAALLDTPAPPGEPPSWLENQQVETKLAVLEGQVAALREEANQTRWQSRHYEEAVETLTGQLTEREAAIAWLESQQKALTLELEARARSLHDLQAHATSREEAVTWLEGQLATMRQDMEAHAHSAQTLRESLSSREEAVVWLEGQLEAMRQEMEARAHSAQALQERLSSREEAVAWLEGQLEAMRQEMETRAHSIQTLQESLHSREEAVAWLEGQLATMRQEMEARARSIQTLQEGLSSREEAVAWLEGQLEATCQEMEAQARSAQTLRENLSSREEAVSWLEGQLAAAHQASSHQQEANQALRATLEARDVTLATLAEKLQALQEQLAKLASEQQEKNARIEALAGENRLMSAHIHEFNEKITAFREKIPVRILEKLRVLEWQSPRAES